MLMFDDAESRLLDGEQRAEKAVWSVWLSVLDDYFWRRKSTDKRRAL